MINNPSYSSTKFITGMRAYAALGVFLIHSGGFGLRQFSTYTDRIVDFGKYGVVAFFVISAFTICMSVEKEKIFSFKNYILKRFFRVAPMYYLVLIIAFLLGGNTYYAQLFNVENDIFSLLYHFSFLNWLNVGHQNNLIGVEWSVPIEFSYYLVIPIFLMFLKNNKTLLFITLILSAFIIIFGDLLYINSSSKISFHWSLIKYLFSFVFGIFIYIIFTTTDFFLNFKYSKLFLLILILAFVTYIIMDFQFKDFFATIFVGFIILACQCKSAISTFLFENKLIQYLGNISYSIYLIHMIFFYHLAKHIQLFKNPYIVFIITILISSLTYYLIEKPFINLAKRIIK